VRRWTRTILITVCSVALVQGCDIRASPRQTSVVSVTATSTTSAAPSTAGESNGQSYTVESTAIDGTTSDKVGTWTTHAGQITGGDRQVADAFNAASRNSVNDLINTVQTEASAESWTFDAKSSVSFQPLAISQVTTGVYVGQGAAHPINYVATVVIDSRDAQPITLKSLFANEQDGLKRLSEKVNAIMGGADTSGSAPTEENFANWIPTDKGMELHFKDYQFGHGLRVETVPWSDLTDLLAPNMRALARA